MAASVGVRPMPVPEYTLADFNAVLDEQVEVYGEKDTQCVWAALTWIKDFAKKLQTDAMEERTWASVDVKNLQDKFVHLKKMVTKAGDIVDRFKEMKHNLSSELRPPRDAKPVMNSEDIDRKIGEIENIKHFIESNYTDPQSRYATLPGKLDELLAASLQQS